MLKRFSSRIGRVGAMLAMGAVVVTGLSVAGAGQAQAAFSGEGCVFNAPAGAPLGPLRMGHVGWGFKNSTANSYTYGATEGPGKRWHKTGTRNQMMHDFKIGGPFHGVGYYTKRKCGTVVAASVSAARAAVKKVESSKYAAIGNNCMDNSYLILTKYGAKLPNPSDIRYWAPNNWFAAIKWGLYPL